MSSIEVSVLPPHLKMIDHGVIAGDRASHLTSLPYCMAVAAVAPDLAFDVGQSPPNLPEDVRTFMDRIKIAADDGLLADYPRTWPARVVVTTGSTRHERLVTHVPGDPARPFDRARVREKFLRFVGPTIGTEKAEQVLARCSASVANGEFTLLLADIEETCSVRSLSPLGRGLG
jgi:2-methylcitrate dehydratase PrpD